MSVALSACGGDKSDASNADSIPTPVNFIDSLSLRYGTQWGAQQARTLALLPDDKRSELNIDEFIAGLRSAVIGYQPTPGVFEGISMGADIASQLDSYSAVGVYVGRAKVADALQKVLLSDTLTSETAAQYQAMFDDKMSIVQNLILEKMRQERRAQALIAEQIRKTNVEAAKDFTAKLQKENPEVKTTATGLFYKIDNPGTGSKPVMGDTVTVVYSIAGLDDRVIDSSRGEAVDIPLDSDLIPGLQEGFVMLGSGGKATFYVPSKLGFSRDSEIVQPGEMIIVEVELKGVKR